MNIHVAGNIDWQAFKFYRNLQCKSMEDWL